MDTHKKTAISREPSRQLAPLNVPARIISIGPLLGRERGEGIGKVRSMCTLFIPEEIKAERHRPAWNGSGGTFCK